jgi:putative ATP-binding cassette transporter
VLLHCPKFAILDEATSALDTDNEALLYAELARTEATLVSVTHHAGLLKYHTNVLELVGDGHWRLTATPAAPDAAPSELHAAGLK